MRSAGKDISAGVLQVKERLATLTEDPPGWWNSMSQCHFTDEEIKAWGVEEALVITINSKEGSVVSLQVDVDMYAAPAPET